MALKDASLSFPQQAEDIDVLIQKRINGKLKVLPTALTLYLALVIFQLQCLELQSCSEDMEMRGHGNERNCIHALPTWQRARRVHPLICVSFRSFWMEQQYKQCNL